MKTSLLLLLVPSASAALLPARHFASRSTNIKCYTTWDAEATAARVQRCLAVKESSGMSFDALATSLGLTNTYTCQLLLGQAQLKDGTAEKLKSILPALEADDIAAMIETPGNVMID